MEEEKETQKTKELPVELAFVVIIFLLIAGQYFFLYLKELEYMPSMRDQAFSLLILLFILFYVISVIGLLTRRVFGYYLALFLVGVETLFSIGYLTRPTYALTMISLVALVIYALIKNRHIFREANKRDKQVALGLTLMVVLYIIFTVYAAVQPTPEEYYQMVSKEAREKGDWRVCDRLSWGRERCKASVVVSKKDPRLCNVVKSINVRFDCYVDVAQALNNRSICDLIDEEIVEDGLQFNESRIDECKGLV